MLRAMHEIAANTLGCELFRINILLFSLHVESSINKIIMRKKSESKLFLTNN